MHGLFLSLLMVVQQGRIKYDETKIPFCLANTLEEFSYDEGF